MGPRIWISGSVTVINLYQVLEDELWSVPTNTTCTAAKLMTSAQGEIAMERQLYTYAAEIANTSARFAPANAMRQIETKTLNPAIVPSLAGIELTKQSTTIEAIGINDARILFMQYVME
ncbi:hypothetical protein A1F97_09935 [Pyrenophora tritici-repentis]|uniref:Uncharacterized protein n=1 Tax=Pyrenophora tritici-repentis TaxID=45151 RepID=A0A2W1DS78_9PLEO|nr:hypothetical protein PtrM4_105690 [Pyrenophora tritici-repentis]KAI1682912.1 hypothetical protein KJE20_07644 [Pyrenophora tritici-repentis]PZD24055.1 hypothetical protein A1F96_09691 [Pyrenophora tritici-repentis]PZD31115.1 hypothetical protein A1F97_09935 [Pyrenophora tritici-repentis]